MLHFYLPEKYCTVLWKQLKYRNVVKFVALMLLSILSDAPHELMVRAHV